MENNEFSFSPTPETEQDIYTETVQTMASCMAMLECMERCRAESARETMYQGGDVDAEP